MTKVKKQHNYIPTTVNFSNKLDEEIFQRGYLSRSKFVREAVENLLVDIMAGNSEKKGKMKIVSISFKKETRKTIDKIIKTRLYYSISELVREALRLELRERKRAEA